MKSVSESEAGLGGATHKLGYSGVAALSLLAANAGLLVLYFLFDLTLFQLVFVYWWEALWIGLFSGLKLLTASLFGSPYENRWIDVSRGSSIFLSVFAILKSAGLFMILLVLTGVALVVAQQELSGTDGTTFVREQGILILQCSLLFFVSHGLSFVINFLVLGEFRRARFGTLLWLPFKRSLALFVTVVASLTVIQAYPGALSMTTYPALLIAVKLVWDFYLHKRERLSFTMLGIHENTEQ